MELRGCRDLGLRARSRDDLSSWRYVAFMAMSNAALILRVPFMWVLTSVLGVFYTLSNLASLGLMTVGRFGIADTVIWRTPTGAHFKASTVPVAESVRLLPPRLVADTLPPRSRRLARRGRGVRGSDRSSPHRPHRGRPQQRRGRLLGAGRRDVQGGSRSRVLLAVPARIRCCCSRSSAPRSAVFGQSDFAAWFVRRDGLRRRLRWH